MRVIQADIALALLLRIIERMGVKKGPGKLAADVFEPKFKMGMLVDGVMATIKGACADIEALLVGDFFRAN